jgi:transposase
MEMKDSSLLEYHRHIMALPNPWNVESVDLDIEQKLVTLKVGYPTGTLVHCPECGKLCGIRDKRQRRWRHLAQMEFRTIVVCDVPRCDCDEHGVKQIHLPWAEAGSQFTLTFEAFAIQLILASRNLSEVERILGASWDAIQGIQKRAVERGLLLRKNTPIRHVGIDEKSFLSHHRYATVVGDLDRKVVLDVARERTEDGARAALEGALSEKQRESVEAIAMDFWEPFAKMATELLPNASIVHDRFHVSQYLGKAVDKVRRGEHREKMGDGDETLKGTKYLWLSNPKNWDAKQKQLYRLLKDEDLKVGRAFAMKESFRKFWDFLYKGAAENFQQRWHFWATHSRLKPFIEVAGTIRRHIDRIMNYFDHRISNAAIEGINSKIQLLKSSARGFRNFENYRTAILFHCGGLDLSAHKSR